MALKEPPLDVSGHDVIWNTERRPWSYRDFLALLAWTAAVVLIFGKAALLQEALFYFDVTEINYPYRDFLAKEFRAGRFSRWMPGLHCGLPLLSESQAGYLHPLKVLYLLLPTWQAFNLDTVLSVWLTGAATYGWLRRHVGPAGALTGCAVFGLGGFVWAHVIHTSMINALPSVPLAFWALERAWDGGRPGPVALGAIALACQVFAGHLQDTVLTGLALGLYGAYRATIERGPRRRVFVLGTAGGMVLLAGLLAAVQWIPSKELLDRSPRAGGLSWGDLTFGSFSPELLPTLLIREAYGTRSHDTDWMDGYYPYQEMNTYLSTIGLVLAALGAAAYRERWVGFWVLLAGLGSVLMLGRYTFLFDAMHRIPIIGSARIPVRYHLWVALAVAALAAVGVDRLGRPGVVRVRWACVVPLILALVSIPILYRAYEPAWTDPELWESLYHRARNGWLGRELALAAGRTIVLTGLGLWLASRAARAADGPRRARLAGALPLVVLADLLGAHWDEVPTVDPSYWTVPPATARYIREAGVPGRVFGVGALSAGEPGYAVRPAPFFRARDTLAWSLAPVWGLRSSGSITPIFDRRMHFYEFAALEGGTRFELEDVAWLLSGGLTDFPRFGQPLRIGSAQVYRNDRALPRARLVGLPVYVRDATEAARTLRALGPSARERIVVEDPDRPLDPGAAASGSCRITRDEPERVEVETASDQAAYLLLADTFDPGWSATLDGRPVPIRPAYVAFRAVFLPAGRHRLSFSYRPAGFAAGSIASLLGVAVALALLVIRRPVVELAATHGPSPWPRHWPWWGAGLAVVILLGSIIGVGSDGRVGIQPRWTGSFHRFTWGAKILAMRPPPPSGL
jgi:hypothetical protein